MSDDKAPTAMIRERDHSSLALPTGATSKSPERALADSGRVPD
jgi:hypothetical protein